MTYSTPKKSDNDIISNKITVEKYRILLMYWVKDRHHAHETFEFGAGTDEDGFLAEIEDDIEHRDIRIAQKQIGKILLGTIFSVLLKSDHQWYCWYR